MEIIIYRKLSKENSIKRFLIARHKKTSTQRLSFETDEVLPTGLGTTYYARKVNPIGKHQLMRLDIPPTKSQPTPPYHYIVNWEHEQYIEADWKPEE